MLIPDNLKSGVTKACRYDPELNPNYQLLAAHYSVAVMPARRYKRKDKVLAAMKERAKLAGIDDETRSNILVNKKGAMISPFFIDQINIKMAARSRTRCLCRPSHPMDRYHALHASVP